MSAPATRTSRVAIALLVFAAATAVMFSGLARGDTYGDMAARQLQQYPWLGTGQGLNHLVVHYDQDDSFYPWQVFMNKSLRDGHFPLWNPYSFGGTPFFANGQSGVLYPPRLLLSYVASPARVHDILIASHLFLAGVAMFLFLTMVGRTFGAALVGGLAWMLNTFALAWQALEHYVAIEVWLPVGMLLVYAAVRRRSWPAAFGLALALELMFVGGNVLFVELALALVAAYGITLLVADRREGRRAIAASLARLVSSGVLFVGMALVSIMPTLHLTGQSARVTLTYDRLGDFQLPWRALENIFKPPLSSGDPYHQALFAGTAVGALALVGLVRAFRGGVTARFAVGVAVVTILFMLHTPVTWVFVHVLPGFGSFKPLGRAAFVLQFALAVLAASGLETVVERLEPLRAPRFFVWRLLGGGVVGVTVAVGVERWARLRYSENVAFAVGVLGALLAVAAAAVLDALLRRRGGPQRDLTIGAAIGSVAGVLLERGVNVRFPTTTAFVASLVVTFALTAVLAVRDRRTLFDVGGRRVGPSFAVVFVVAVAVSVVGQERSWASFAMPHQPAKTADLYPSTPIVRALEAKGGAHVLLTSSILRGSTPMMYGLESVGGYESLLSRRVQNFWRVVGEGIPPAELPRHKLIYAYFSAYAPASLQPALLARAGVAYVATGPADVVPAGARGALRTVYSGRDGRIFAVRGVQPEAYFARGCVVAGSAPDALARFISQTAPRTAVLERGYLDKARATCRSADPRASASISRRSLNALEVDVRTATGGWLVVDDSWDDGWHASVDGRSAPVLPANSVFRAVPVPAGAHHVKFTYEPASLHVWIVVSAVSLGVVLVGLLMTGIGLGRLRGFAPLT